MSKLVNETRAEWAQVAIDAFTDRVSMDGEGDETILTDLLADLRHWANTKGISYEEADRRSEYHYNCELDEELENAEV